MIPFIKNPLSPVKKQTLCPFGSRNPKVSKRVRHKKCRIKKYLAPL
jgi:hypothetical protein